MTTYYPNGFSFKQCFNLFLVFGVLASGILLGTHALKHSQAETVRNCPRNQLKLTLYNPTTKRTAYVCQPDPNIDSFGRMITEIENGIEKEITSFLGSEARKNTLKHVVKNLVNQGYTEIKFADVSVEQVVKIILSGVK